MARPVGLLCLSSLFPTNQQVKVSTSMAPKKDQQADKNAKFILGTSNISIDVVTRSKAKATVIPEDDRTLASAKKSLRIQKKKQGAISFASKESGIKSVIPNTVSNLESQTHSSVGDIGTPLKSSTNYSVTHPTAMQAMVTGATIVEEQLAQMAIAIEKLTKNNEDKDLQIASLLSKVEGRWVDESRKGAEDADLFAKEATEMETSDREVGEKEDLSNKSAS